eukprot:6565736-Pyramimonas_sp.AAC.1
MGGLSIKGTLTIDAESVFNPLSSKDLKRPTECTFFWTRQLDTTGDGEESRIVSSGATLATDRGRSHKREHSYRSWEERNPSSMKQNVMLRAGPARQHRLRPPE